MGKTISTHNGGYTQANREHNVRNPKVTDKLEHIDKSLRNFDEMLHDEKPREAYRRIFGEALAAYNEKQTRPERQIRDYFAHVEKDSKKHPVYEMIIQIGDRNDTGWDAPVERECLKEFYAGWKERNPHLECIGAYLHADERDGTVHMHIDYVPVATGYKNGLERQNGLVKALGQQGFVKDGKETAQIKWERRENAALEEICVRHGIEVVHPEGEKKQHLDTALYKAQQRVKELEEKIEEIQKEYLLVSKNLQAANSTLSHRRKLIDGLKEELASAKAELDIYEGAAETAKENVGEYLSAMQEAEIRTQEASEKHESLQEDISNLQKQKEALEASVASLEDVLTTAEVEAIKGEKTVLGGLKGVTYKEYEALKRTAALVDSIVEKKDAEIAGLVSKNNGLEAALAQEKDISAKNASLAETEQKKGIGLYQACQIGLPEETFDRIIALADRYIQSPEEYEKQRRAQLEEQKRKREEQEREERMTSMADWKAQIIAEKNENPITSERHSRQNSKEKGR